MKGKKAVPQKYKDVGDEYAVTAKKRGFTNSNMSSHEDVLEQADADTTEFLALLPADYPLIGEDVKV